MPLLTPDKTIVNYRLAGLGARVWAHVIDLLAFAGMLIITFQVLALYAERLGITQQITAVELVLGSLGIFVYFILFEGLWNGQTPGKKVVGLRVRMSDGTPITFGAALGRNLIRPADMLPGSYLVGVGAMFLNPRSQRLGDLVADTVVTYDRKHAPNFRTAPHRVGIHPLEHAVGDLNGMTREEYEALRRFCDRCPQLSSPTQERFFKELWQPIADRRHVPNLPNVHPLYLAEATVMKYGRQHGLL